MKKYDTGLGPTKISMSEGPRRLGREYASPEIQLPQERYARYWLFRAARIEASVIWNDVWDAVRTTVRATRTANCCAAAWLTARTVTDSASPTIEARPTPTSSSSHTRAR